MNLTAFAQYLTHLVRRARLHVKLTHLRSSDLRAQAKQNRYPEDHPFFEDYLRSSLQSALWDDITPNFVQVSAHWEASTSTIQMYFYCATEPSEEDADLADDVTGHVISDFSEGTTIDFELLVPPPNGHPRQHLVTAYRTWELEQIDPGSRDREGRGPLATLENPESSKSWPGFLSLQLLYPLLGQVTNSLLQVNYRWNNDDRHLTIFFHYDIEQPSELDVALANEVINEVGAALPQGISVSGVRMLGFAQPRDPGIDCAMMKYRGE